MKNRNLRKALAERKATQEELAEVLQEQQPFISRLINRYDMTKTQQSQIVRALDESRKEQN